MPNGDFFAAIRAGEADVVPDGIDRFTVTGLLLKSGQRLEAAIIVTATGLRISVLGGTAFSADAQPVDPAKSVTWRGMMFTDLPNLARVFGCLGAASTPRAERVADMVLRLVAPMQATGATKVVPLIPPTQARMPRPPFIDPDDFSAGYLTRTLDAMPRRPDSPEWSHT